MSGAAISSVSPVIDLVCDCRVLDLFPPAAGARRVLGDCGRPGWVGGSTGCVSGDSSRNKSSRSAFVGVFLPVLRAGGACRFGEPVPPPRWCLSRRTCIFLSISCCSCASRFALIITGAAPPKSSPAQYSAAANTWLATIFIPIRSVSMPPKSNSTLKRKRGKNPGTESEKGGAILASSAFTQPLWSTEEKHKFKAEVRAEAVLMTCRAALVKSPEASRAALLKYRASLDSGLVKMLETVGAYECEVQPPLFFRVFRSTTDLHNSLDWILNRISVIS